MSRLTSTLIIGLCLTSGFGTFAQLVSVESSRRGPERNETLLSPEKRPIIRYGRQRTSKGWLEVDRGRVAVDDFIEWRGQRYYLTLTYDLVATVAPAQEEEAAKPQDGKSQETSERTVWKRNIGAFWNQLGIEVFADTSGNEAEVLALRSTAHPDYVEYAALDTGKRVGGADPGGTPPGDPLALAGSWKGAEARSDAKRMEIVRTATAWSSLRSELFGDLESAPPETLPIDFDQFLVVVLFSGKGTNCNGYSGEAFENSQEVVIRVTAHTYQSMGETPPRWPYGIFAVPIRKGKDLVTQRNAQNLIGGPEMWREWHRWTVD